jgi:hypothetical protein
MSSADFVFLAAIIFVIGCSVYYAPRIGADRVAMQWGLDGKPTWYAPKWLALWGMVVFMLGVRLFILWAATYTPQYVHGVDAGIIGFSVVVAAAHLYTLSTAAKAD